MGLRFRYSDPLGIDEPAAYVTLGSNVRFSGMTLALSAELAEAAVSGVGIEDPGGLYDFQGLRAFEVAETSAASNNQIIGRFAISDQKIGRKAESGLMLGADRHWDIDLVDYNWHAGKRVLVDSDSKRPEETAGDRLRWLINDAAHININDYGYVTYPTKQLDAADFRLQRPIDVLADCSVEDAYLFWLDYNEAHGRPELFFLDPDSSTYQATIGVANEIALVDNVETFYPYRDANLTRTPRQIAYGVALPYENGFVYVRKDSTGQQFAKQDQVAPMKNVKKAARARRIATKFLNNNDDQVERISFSFKVPWAQVNDVRQGQLMNVLFSHLPGYETWKGIRVLRKFVTQEPEGGADYALISIEGTPATASASLPSPATRATSGGIWYVSSDNLSVGTLAAWDVDWQGTGDSHGPGYADRALDTTAFSYHQTSGYDDGFTVVATSGTLDVRVIMSLIWAHTEAVDCTFTGSLKKNGSIVASQDVPFVYTGWGSTVINFDFTGSDLAAVAGDVFTAHISKTGPAVGLTIPAGSGQGMQMEILGTSTVAG